MKDEYIIISKTKLLERIEELKKPIVYYDGIYVSDSQNAQIELIEELLSQSTPLIPEIKKHSIEFTKTLLNCTVSATKSINNIKEYHPKEYQLLLGELELNGKEIFEDYISNLKLDI